MLGISIGKYVIIAMVLIALVGSAVMYVKWTSDTISTLNQQVAAVSAQATSLKAASDAMRTDVDTVKQAQDTTNKQLSSIQAESTQMANKIRSQVLNTSNPQALQTQINKDTATTFQTLEDLTK